MNSTFPRVRRTQAGYNIEQVEDFLEEARRAYGSDVQKVTGIDAQSIRRVSFEMTKGGYSPEHVDNALDRLEDAFAKRERERAIGEEGEEDYFGRIQAEAVAVLEQLSKPNEERFTRLGPFRKGYRVEQVDEFAEAIVSYLNDGPEMSPEQVRQKSFDAQRGGYDEDEVDDVLDRVIFLMQAVR